MKLSSILSKIEILLNGYRISFYHSYKLFRLTFLFLQSMNKSIVQTYEIGMIRDNFDKQRISEPIDG